jgi:hypothetical protein
MVSFQPVNFSIVQENIAIKNSQGDEEHYFLVKQKVIRRYSAKISSP